jgi:hypothetical protein
VKPHLGHLYVRPNFLHFPQRFIWISPQLGQRNFVASVPGGMGLPQLVHVTSDNVAAFSDIMLNSVTRFVIVRLPYIFCVRFLKFLRPPLFECCNQLNPSYLDPNSGSMQKPI